MTATSTDTSANRARSRRPRPLTPLLHQPEPPELRQWAYDNGFEIAERGRIPEEVQAAWAEAEVRDKVIVLP